ncbi:zinc-dependent alcohol dehydrogenase family protein [Mycetocola saprophilus]|uniref:zinc-dependent alcohol dehydrogenase family protein n=1 Tax=Mycetocola saprophilus TaxID=76636 RepID=UPI003BF12EED
MRATIIHGAGDVRVETVPDPVILEPTDAIVRIVRACICGSDLHPFHNKPAGSDPRAIGHEFIGVVEDTGSAVRTVSRGDFVIAPFVWSDGTCEFCREGLFTSCLHGGDWGDENVGGGQGEATRVPQADGTLIPVPGITEDSDLLPSLLTLSDVYGTGYHAAITAGVRPGETVVVIGDGAVGLLAVLSAKQLGAEKIILMGRHEARTNLGREFGATDVVSARGEEGIAQVRELSGGHGAHRVLEAVGFLPAYEQALGVVRPGGAISRVGVPQYVEAPAGRVLFRPNVTLTGGVAPVRKYIDTLLPLVLDGTVDPGRVFDMTVSIEDVPSGYVAMDERRALKVLVKP